MAHPATEAPFRSERDGHGDEIGRIERLPADVTRYGGEVQRRPPSSTGAIGMVVVGIVVLQAGSAGAVRLFDRTGPGGAVLLRLGLAALVLLAVHRPPVRRFDRRDWTGAGLLGLALGAMNLAFYEAIDRIPLGVAVTLELAGPIAVALAASRRRRDLAAVALAAAGVLLLTPLAGGGSDLDGTGVAFALVAAACWAAYILANQVAGGAFAREVGTGAGLAVAMVIATAVVAPYAVPAGGTSVLQPGALLLGLGVALASSVVPYSLELEALRRLPTRSFGVLMSLEPAVAATWGVVLLHQHLHPVDAAAIVCVVVASTLAAVTASRAAPPPLDA